MDQRVGLFYILPPRIRVRALPWGSISSASIQLYIYPVELSRYHISSGVSLQCFLMAGQASRDFNAASLAAPVGWAFTAHWAKLADWAWWDLCDATGCGKGLSSSGPSKPLAESGQRALAAAFAVNFWPGHFDRQVDAAHAFGAPPRLLSRRLPAVKAFVDGRSAETFRLPRAQSDGVAVPQLGWPDAGAPVNTVQALRWQRERDWHADNQARRRQRVRLAADNGVPQANAEMDKELARGKKRRLALHDFDAIQYSIRVDTHARTRAG